MESTIFEDKWHMVIRLIYLRRFDVGGRVGTWNHACKQEHVYKAHSNLVHM
jgi:hypothetical protein